MRSDRNVAVNGLITQLISVLVPGWTQRCWVPPVDNSILLWPGSEPEASMGLVASHLTTDIYRVEWYCIG